MEQQVKERLTGGVILVVLLVLLVPELLTGPRPAPQPPQAQPDQAPMRSYTMELGESTHANSAPVAASTTAPAPAPAPAVGESAAPTSSAAASAPPQARVEMSPPPPPTAPAHPAATQHGGTLWTVQLGTFNSRENATRLVTTLKSRGFSASVSEATRNGHKLFRVRVGAERDRTAAQKLQGRLTAAGAKGGEVIAR